MHVRQLGPAGFGVCRAVLAAAGRAQLSKGRELPIMQLRSRADGRQSARALPVEGRRRGRKDEQDPPANGLPRALRREP
jgi:hypothetical protein